MPKVSIERFRSILASHAEHGPAVGAYRALSRRPAAALEIVLQEWPVWNADSMAATNA